jgi:hypothetical protein
VAAALSPTNNVLSPSSLGLWSIAVNKRMMGHKTNDMIGLVTSEGVKSKAAAKPKDQEQELALRGDRQSLRSTLVQILPAQLCGAMKMEYIAIHRTAPCELVK